MGLYDDALKVYGSVAAMFQSVGGAHRTRESSPEDTPPPGYGAVYAGYTGEGGTAAGRGKTTTALQQPTGQQDVTQQQQPALTLPTQGPGWEQETLGQVGLALQGTRLASSAAKAFGSRGIPDDVYDRYVRGNMPLPDNIWNQYVTNPNWTPNYVSRPLPGQPNRQALMWEEGMGYEPGYEYRTMPSGKEALVWEEGMGIEGEEGVANTAGEYLGSAANIASTGLAAYNVYRSTQGEGTPIGTTQASGTLLGAGWAPYLAYYQMGAAVGSIAEQKGEKGGEIAGYPTEPLMAAPMSGGRILGSLLGGEADVNAEELSYEQSGPERWLLGKEEWNREKTATSMNPALDPINIVTSALTGKDSTASNITAALANPVGAYAKDLVQGELFSTPESWFTGGLNIFGGGGPSTQIDSLSPKQQQAHIREQSSGQFAEGSGWQDPMWVDYAQLEDPPDYREWMNQWRTMYDTDPKFRAAAEAKRTGTSPALSQGTAYDSATYQNWWEDPMYNP